ncbi:MAG: SMP-30/gluconolactonase/LRE family protein [Candidatus Tectimicrobiota bacterium]
MGQWREITSGLRFPEGPVALSDGSVLLVEIARGTLSRVQPDGTVQVVATPGGGPNGAALGPDGKCYVCNNGGLRWRERHGQLHPGLQPDTYTGGRIERIDLRTGAVDLLYTGTAEVPLRGPNDLVFDAHGGFWFTDNGKTRRREQDRTGVFYATADGSRLTEVIFPLLTPNGIGLSPDGKRLYVAESLTTRLWAFDIIAPGVVSREPWPNGGTLVAGLPGYQIFDSLAVDSAGNICIGTLMRGGIDQPGGITVMAPDGDPIEFIALPDPYVTNICFGGPELRTAYITLSASGRLIAMEWPRPGLQLHYN